MRGVRRYIDHQTLAGTILRGGWSRGAISRPLSVVPTTTCCAAGAGYVTDMLRTDVYSVTDENEKIIWKELYIWLWLQHLDARSAGSFFSTCDLFLIQRKRDKKWTVTWHHLISTWVEVLSSVKEWHVVDSSAPYHTVRISDALSIVWREWFHSSSCMQIVT